MYKIYAYGGSTSVEFSEAMIVYRYTYLQGTPRFVIVESRKMENASRPQFGGGILVRENKVKTEMDFCLFS